MGDFYQVIKTIKGHRYVYRQRTFRRGGAVKTESHYVGPAGAGDVTRITAEREVRRNVPTFGQVAAAVKVLADPKRAATAWLKPWGEKGAVNTTFARHDGMDRHLASLGVTIVEHPDAEGAAYNLLHDAVVIPSGSRFKDRPDCTSTEAFYFTLMHEVAHWTGSVNRLNRTVIGKGRIDSPEKLAIYAREEMVVETTAYLVMAKFGQPIQDKAQSAWYFQHYLAMVGNKEAALEYVQNEAHRATEYILASPKLRAIKVQHGLV